MFASMCVRLLELIAISTSSDQCMRSTTARLVLNAFTHLNYKTEMAAHARTVAYLVWYLMTMLIDTFGQVAECLVPLS